MFFGIYMIMVFDPQILFNDGFYDLVDVRIPEGSLLKPRLSGGAVVPHARARPHLRHPRRPARPAAAGVPLRRRVLVVAAPHVLGLPAGRRVVSSSTRSASAASPAGRSATARTGTRCGRRSPTCRTSSSRRTSRCASSRTRRSPTPAAPGCFRGGNGIDVVYRFLEPGDDLDPRRPLVHLSLGRQRRRAGRALAQVAGAHRRLARGAAPASATTSRSSRATCCTT